MLGLALLLPLTAFACKPTPVPDCADKTRVNFREVSFDPLSSKVKELQSSLDLALRTPPKGQSDCFNNHFASYYLEQAKAYAQKHDKLICPKHIDDISFQVAALTDEDSAEWKAVKDEAVKKKLETQALVVKGMLHDFLVVHSKP